MLELRDAAEWYENEREGLGAELIEEFEQTLDAALQDPNIGIVVARTNNGEAVRRFRLSRFHRYAIYLARIGDFPTVVVFEHASRHPEYWLRRLQ